MIYLIIFVSETALCGEQVNSAADREPIWLIAPEGQPTQSEKENRQYLDLD